MTRRDDSRIIRIVHPICCGLDVHKESVSACLIFPDDKGEEQYDVKVFGTFTDDLMRLRDWLAEHNCPVVAMESTGVYWRPVHNVLEDSVAVVLANARDMHNVSGRKTDIGDSKWIAGLLRHGLLKSSFIPPQDVRQWRDLTRLRKKYVHTVGDYRKRTHKLFESANIKIDGGIGSLRRDGTESDAVAGCGPETDIVGYSNLCSWETEGQRGGTISIHSGLLYGSSPVRLEDDLSL